MDDGRTRREHFTDAEAAFLRHARFGALPPRVRPSELVESVDTGRPHHDDPPAYDPRVIEKVGG